MGFSVINGQRIYARDEGQSNAQVALLIHGWSSSWYALSPLLPLLSKRFYCLAVDLPGYGKSPPPTRRISIPYYADLLAELARQYTDNPIVIVGHSMGGMTALTMALRHPELVERMVLLNPTITGRLSTRITWAVQPIIMLERFSVAGRVISSVEPHLLNVTDKLMRPISFAERSGITAQEYERLRADARRRGEGRVRAECYHAMRANDLTDRLPEIEAPSLVLWGAEDNTVPLRDAGIVADEWSNADLRIIPNAGHWPHFETPQITRRHIAAFLGLPLVTTQLDDANTNNVYVSAAAQFLSHSDIGNGLTLAQRTRLAAMCSIRTYSADEMITKAQESSTDLYVVQEGTVQVWSEPVILDPQSNVPSRRVATLLPGQITGELALLDGGRRSASLRAGEEGATILVLRRNQLVALINDDPQLGNRVIWNIATSLALRLRLSNWAAQRAQIEQQKQHTAEAEQPTVAEPPKQTVEEHATP